MNKAWATRLDDPYDWDLVEGLDEQDLEAILHRCSGPYTGERQTYYMIDEPDLRILMAAASYMLYFRDLDDEPPLLTESE